MLVILRIMPWFVSSKLLILFTVFLLQRYEELSHSTEHVFGQKSVVQDESSNFLLPFPEEKDCKV